MAKRYTMSPDGLRVVYSEQYLAEVKTALLGQGEELTKSSVLADAIRHVVPVLTHAELLLAAEHLLYLKSKHIGYLAPRIGTLPEKYWPAIMNAIDCQDRLCGVVMGHLTDKMLDMVKSMTVRRKLVEGFLPMQWGWDTAWGASMTRAGFDRFIAPLVLKDQISPFDLDALMRLRFKGEG